MRSRVYLFWAVVAASLAIVQLLAARLPTKQDSRLQPVFQSNRIWNAVARTNGGRTFVGFADVEGPGAEVEELAPDGQGKAYPDLAWNSWTPGHALDKAFVHVSALRIGPDGALWIVDAGAQGLGKPPIAGAARIFRFDLATNALTRVYSLAPAVAPQSFIDDIRFNGHMAYITDAGAPALIVLDLDSGQARRVLDNDASTTGKRPMYADGKLLRTPDRKPLHVHADQLEVSPDGRTLYFQPASGPLARIETRYLDDPKLPPAELARHVQKDWVETPTTGGTAIDANGTIYLSDANQRRILTISPQRKITTLITDPRLIWVHSMWIDRDGNLWIPATQLNLTAGFAGGRQKVGYPVFIYKLQIGVGPPANDHP
ncbi:L-dopachrome tautomerase-related protein [uncultured Methylovirgula sp.]|uniref:L-dopachrome tautomerase-related protein n=1 Tax=uncultured Methylovirgula sp. TaxID=1285960 RepID=UPI002636C9EA|nr:L-dopachrome tautomerase-related protein [uncultured Methylovirgula sp.]